MVVIIDTSAYSAVNRAQAERIKDQLETADEVLLSTVVIGELRAGFAAGNRRAENEAQLRRFAAMHKVTTITITDTTTHTYANLFAELRRRGTPISPNDMWIAAQALEHNAQLLTTDSDFERVPDLDLLMA